MLLMRSLLSTALIISATSSWAAAPTPAQISQSRIAGLAWLMSHQSGEGSWKANSGSAIQPTSAAISALSNAGVKQGYPYSAAVAYLQNAEAPSVDSLSRQIMTLNSTGANVAPLIAKLNQWQNAKGAWGAYKGYGSSLPDTPLAISALFQTHTANTTTLPTTLCSGLLIAQRPDNSFPPLVTGVSGSPTQSGGALIPTLYAALAINAITANTGWGGLGCPTSYTFSTMVSNAATWMLSKQSAIDGGFGDFGSSTILETALVYQALNQISPTVYVTALGNAQGYLIAQQRADGSWGSDPLATALALQTLPSLLPGTLVDANKNGIPDAVETFLGQNPAAPNRTLVASNGQGILGLTASQLIASGIQSQPFTTTMTVSGGTAPYTWSVASGYLPDGLTINAATGQILGTPTTAGTFNFSYIVKDASNLAAAAGAQIQIASAAPANDTDVPTLPQWGVILMAMMLIGSVAIKSRKQ
jgi:Putative Ig domain/Prenyltransferase and squalene oxidase repeat